MKTQYRDSEGDVHTVQVEEGATEGALRVTVGDETFEIRGQALSTGRLHLQVNGRPQAMHVARSGAEVFAAIGTRRLTLSRETGGRRKRGGADAGGSLTSPMPGQVLKVLVSEGDSVTKGQTLLIIEAMKMEHAIKAPSEGVVTSLPFAEGEMVTPGAALAVIEPAR